MHAGDSVNRIEERPMSKQNNVRAAEAADITLNTGSAADVARERVSPDAAREAVTREVSSWDGVSVHAHRFGGVEFRLGRRELGHLHGSIADLPFPRCIREELVTTGRARPHLVLPDSGWVTVTMRTGHEVANMIELFRQNYRRATNGPR
jgi:hypothetical protein